MHLNRLSVSSVRKSLTRTAFVNINVPAKGFVYVLSSRKRCYYVGQRPVMGVYHIRERNEMIGPDNIVKAELSSRR